MTKIRHGKLSATDAEINGGKKGDAYVVLTVRVRNQSKQKVETAGVAFVSYGPDGVQAESIATPGDDAPGMSGTILPGKAKTEDRAWVIPTQYQNDVVLEYTATDLLDPAIFAGSVKV